MPTCMAFRWNFLTQECGWHEGNSCTSAIGTMSGAFARTRMATRLWLEQTLGATSHSTGPCCW